MLNSSFRWRQLFDWIGLFKTSTVESRFESARRRRRFRAWPVKELRRFETLETRAMLSGSPPINTVPGPVSVNEDTVVAIAGISVEDTELAPAVHNEIQVWDFTARPFPPSGATVDFTWGGTTMTYHYYEDDVQDFFEALVGSGNVQTTMGYAAITIEFIGDLATSDVDEIVPSSDSDGPYSVVSTTQQGENNVPLATLELSVGHGSLTLASDVTNGVTAGEICGNGSGSVVVTAPLAAINATLASSAGLSYVGNSNFNGTDVMTVTSNDRGITGSVLTDTDYVAISVAAVNDAPVNTVPSVVSGNEDTAVAIAGISIADLELTPAVGSPGQNEIQVWNFTARPYPPAGATVDFTWGATTMTYHYYDDVQDFFEALLGEGNVQTTMGYTAVTIEFIGDLV